MGREKEETPTPSETQGPPTKTLGAMEGRLEGEATGGGVCDEINFYLLMDQVIDNCRSKRLRTKLLAERDLKLEHVLDLAATMEASECQAAQMVQDAERVNMEKLIEQGVKLFSCNHKIHLYSAPPIRVHQPIRSNIVKEDGNETEADFLAIKGTAIPLMGKGVQVKWHIDTFVPPVAQKHSRMPFHRRDKVAKKIVKLEAADFNRENVRPDRVGIENCDAFQANETGRDNALRGHEGSKKGHFQKDTCDAHSGRVHHSV
ncbi:hypothetical protein NP493_3264g00007 [Ridgeia piscesae]|uniref:Uncharacterized protein n=1 Tax=Ridgeia piscesae TaxID=27915 RepID=A0AAD9J972_RIDPI|nr:hypothetical protein NP493_3264g00007 [Ridgeia piscesae]